MNGQGVPLGPPFAALPRESALQGPGQFFFAGEDAIQLDIQTQTPTVTITITGTMLGEGLQVLPFSYVWVLDGVSTNQTVRFAVDSGWLQSIRAIITTGVAFEGQLWMAVRRCRGLKPNALVTATITTQYLTTQTDLYWPGGVPQLPLDGEGTVYGATIANPAAGADWVYYVPLSIRMEIISIHAVLTTSAVVANRQVRLVIDDQTPAYFWCPSPVAITAGTAVHLSWGAGAGGPMTGDPTAMSMPLPNDMFLIGNSRIRTITGAIDVGDQFSQIRIWSRVWMEGN